MIALLTFALAGLSPASPVSQQPPAPTELASWRAAAAYSEERGGLALLVRRGGEVAFEQYAPGFGPDKPFLVYSGCLGFWAVAAMAAVQDGLLDLDERVSATVEEWRGVAGKEAITLHQLLRLESGLAANDKRVRDAGTKDHYQAALETAMVALPGESFRFGPTAWFVLGVLLERKLADRQEDALAYLQRRVLEPIGLEVYYWGRDGAGRVDLPAGAYLTAPEWSKLGQLLLDRGRFGDQVVVADELLAECSRPSPLRPSYGLGFWLHGALDGSPADTPARGGQDEPQVQREEERAAALPPDVIFSAGYGKQRMYVLPSTGLVVVRQAVPGSEWSDVDFLRLLLGIDPPPSDEGLERDG